jgi:hypothetical protein
MAQQGTEEQTSSDQPSEESTGRHRADGEGAPDEQSSSEESASKDSGSQDSSSKDSSSEAKTEKQSTPPSEAKTEKQQTSAAPKREADTSWADRESTPRRHVDVGEIAWRAGNVIATVLRTLAFLFAAVLVVNVVLILVGVNPANGVAQFLGGLADRVILGFRDLFVPADPTIGLIVNSLVAAVFWVLVGEFASRVVRFLAARVK